MNDLTTADKRALARISTAAGGMMIVAADQRNSMKAVMHAPGGAAAVSTAELHGAKADLVTYLSTHGPAILLDPEVALPDVVDRGILGSSVGLVVGLDASGFTTEGELRFTTMVDGVSPATVRAWGGDAAKMLWYLRTDLQSPDSRVGQEMRDLIQACAAEGVLLIVEILTYRLSTESEADYAQLFPTLIRDAATFAVACGAKVLKLPYPGSAAACRAVTDAADGVPWAVLSAGVDHETFIEQVRAAVRNGASGAMAGRSLWKDSLSISPEERRVLLTERAAPRLEELVQVIDAELLR